MSHMQSMYVPFHLGYGGFMCSKRLQSERPKCGGILVDPGTLRKHAEIGLFVPGLNHTYQLENLKNFVSLDSSISPLSNDVW